MRYITLALLYCLFTNNLVAGSKCSADYVIVGVGTAGAVLAKELSDIARIPSLLYSSEKISIMILKSFFQKLLPSLFYRSLWAHLYILMD